MRGDFSVPNVDHLTEGVHYHVVDWDFAACESDEKMVFGLCRKVGGTGDKDFDSSKRSKQEEQLSNEAQKQGAGASTKEQASAANKKAFTVEGKKFGWAIKGGKPVIVAWGSVAGEAKVGPKQKVPFAKQPTQSQSSAVQTNRVEGLKKALASQTTESGRQAIQSQIRQLGG
jgi:hypothetical protein